MQTVVRVRFPTSSKTYDYFVPQYKNWMHLSPYVNDYVVTNTAMPTVNDATETDWETIYRNIKLASFSVAKIIEVLENPKPHEHTAVKPYICLISAEQLEAVNNWRLKVALDIKLEKQRAADLADLKAKLGSMLVEAYMLPGDNYMRCVFTEQAKSLRSRIQELTNEH